MIERVDSAGDPRIAGYARVGDARWLRERGLFVAEGRFVFERLLDAPRFVLESAIVTDSALRALGERASHLTAPVYVCSREVLEGVTGFDFHRGCVALARRPEPLPVEDCIGPHPLVLAVEGVGNPDNVGGLFRVAAAFGAAVLVGPATADPLYRKAVRTSMGAVFGVRWTEIAPWPMALGALRSRGYRVAALTPGPDAIPLADYVSRRPKRAVVLVGAEGTGLTGAALEAADDRVRIPVSSAVDSLNVTVAAGIALHGLSELPGSP